MIVIGYLARSWYCFLHIHPMNEMSGRSRKKGYRIHRNHIKECLQEVYLQVLLSTHLLWS
jgi:hypothetical protein